PVRVGPRFFAGGERCRVAQALGGNQSLQSRKPMFVVMRAVVGLTAIGGGLELLRKRRGPFLPSEMPMLGEFHGKRKRLRLPRFGKHRVTLSLIAWQAR